MKRYIPNKEEIEEAKILSSNAGVYNNSIISGNGNFYGFLAEGQVKKYLSSFCTITDANTKDYDFIANNKTIEIKTTETRFFPQHRFHANINKYSIHQKPDLYIFTMYFKNKDTHEIYIMSWSTSEMFFKKARFFKQGEINPANNHRQKSDVYLLRYDELDDIETLNSFLEITTSIKNEEIIQGNLF